MEIGATKAVQDRLKTTKIEESKGASLVFCWDTHLTKIKGRNVLFIVNASNRYTIAMTDIELRNWNYYAMYISCVIHGVMQEKGYSEDQIGQYFKMSGDATVTKTHGRKSVGGINRMVMDDIKDTQFFGKVQELKIKIFAMKMLFGLLRIFGSAILMRLLICGGRGDRINIIRCRLEVNSND